MKWKELPNFETMRLDGQRFAQFDASAIEAFVTLLFISGNLEIAFDAHLQRHNLSKGRFMILILLNRAKTAPMSPAGLADCCGVTRATVTGLLDTLETAGYVKREPDPVDRRGLVVRLTPTGKQQLDDLFPEHYARISKVMSHLDEAERDQLVGLLKKVADNIPAMRDP